VTAALPDDPHTVPPALSAFVGRVRDLEELGAALARTRLLTLTGVGGVGKTRLARELAVRAAGGAAYPNGVWWIDLAPVAAGAEVPQVVTAFGVRPGPGASVEEVIALIAGALRGAHDHPRGALLVLDNCEHVVDAAAILADRLLRAAPGLTILATSREALGVEGETVRPIAPLSHPVAGVAPTAPATAAGAQAYEAVLLFTERARAAHPGFALTDRTAPVVAAVCARLDGIPLALELAAAALPTFGLDGLAARLDDALAVLTRGRRTAAARHRTLRAVLDWSYTLLAPDERRLLEALAVCRGPVAFDTVSRVAGHEADVGASLDRLVAQSLVEVRAHDGEVRYRLLEPVRQYALARLEDDPARANAVRVRHAGWVRALAEDAEPRLWSPDRARTVARLQPHLDDIRAALAWATEPGGDVLAALRIVGALTYFWLTGGLWQDGARWVAAAIGASEREGTGGGGRSPEERLARSGAEHLAALLSWYAGRFDAALTLGDRALARVADLTADLATADAALRPRALILATQLRAMEAHAAMMVGDGARSEASLRVGLASALASGDGYTVAGSLLRAAMVHVATGALARAESEYADAERRLRALDDRWMLSLCYTGLAELALGRGDASTAADHARTAVALLRTEPDAWFASRALDVLAAAGALTLPRAGSEDARYGAASAVARVLGAATALRARVGATLSEFDRPKQEAAAAAAREVLGDAFTGAWADGERTSLAEVFALAEAAPVLAAQARGTSGAAATTEAPATRDPTDGVADGSPSTLWAVVLGPLRITRLVGAREEPVALTTGKMRELFLFLAAHPDGVTRAQIGRALWPDAGEEKLANAFHPTLHHLRRALGARDWVRLSGGRYRLERATGPNAALDCDLDAVLGAAARLRRARVRREALDDAELAALGAALARRVGPFGDGVAAGDWLVAQEDRIAAAWSDAMVDLGALLVARGTQAAVRDALATYDAILAHDPLREDVHRELMRCHVLLGEPARAVAHFEALSAALRREVGATPARETVALAESIRRGAHGGPSGAPSAGSAARGRP
jgi:predicted ATPase/DNA-binding SARP family transcriptional activator